MANLLDSDGMPVAAKRQAIEFIEERMKQFEADRLEAIKNPIDLQKWRTFVLRWAEPLHVVTAPPGGWDNEQLLLPIIHSARVVTDGLSEFDKLASAMWLQQRGHKLPNGLRIENGVLIGGHVGPAHVAN
jgi:hypothetical protein